MTVKKCKQDKPSFITAQLEGMKCSANMKGNIAISKKATKEETTESREQKKPEA